ncbi:TPA: hypothetical protein ACVGKW_005622, partial [Pseudomonas aeruginosa]
LDSKLSYAEALKPFFPEGTQLDDIRVLLCPSDLKKLMSNVSVTGKSRRRAQNSAGETKNGTEDAGPGDDRQ